MASDETCTDCTEGTGLLTALREQACFSASDVAGTSICFATGVEDVGTLAGEGVFTSPAAAFTREMNYESVWTACLKTRKSDPNGAKDYLIRIYHKHLPLNTSGTSRKLLSCFRVVTLL
ncbi:hypothetical protein llap_3103 [Limosa lapponica baueri]|uniref:Uncharacterized protein n=1 Tax=Limosa lapponica baueri TaxID=1758121 RepID=A0A2I0UKP0_LIMLA|nr:hypothetical protein llap_3103 [Limosa lapponica baueri]